MDFSWVCCRFLLLFRLTLSPPTPLSRSYCRYAHSVTSNNDENKKEQQQQQQTTEQYSLFLFLYPNNIFLWSIREVYSKLACVCV